MKLQVKTYSGYKADERPVSFTVDGQEHQVEEIVEQWRGEEYEFWKIKTADGKRFLLKYHPVKNKWEVDNIGIMK